jgi:hypothetical protein
MKKKPPGLYANIQAKRARGEKMRKPGEEGAPSAQDFKNAAKTAKKKKGAKRQDPGYKMYDKEGCKTCDGGKKPCKCSKKDMVGRKSGYADGYGKKCDSIAAEFNAVMDTEAREDKPCGASFIPQNAKCSKGAGQAKKPEAGQGKPQFSDKQKSQAIRKIAAERFKGVKSEKLRSAIKAGKGNKSLEGRTVQKAAKREMFNRGAKTALQGALVSPAVAMYMESRRNKKRS